MFGTFRWMSNFTQSPEGKLWDGEATPATGDTGAPPAAATPAASAPQPATPAAPAPGPATAGPGDGWVPSYRIRETREAAAREAQQQFAQREYAYQTELQRIQNQLHALVGVQPPQNPEVAAVRQQFGSLYPGLTKLEERAQQLMELMDRSGDMESQNSHYWQSYGRQTMDRLFEHASQSLGSPLTDEGKRQLHSSFLGFVQSSPELTERYANDPSIVNDFWKVFTSSFIDPVRRSATAGAVGRIAGAMPQDTAGGAPRATPAPKPADLDERTAQAWAHYQTIAKP
jgi:hypothetical protein